MGKHFPLSLLIPYLLCSQWQSPHQCGVCIGLYTLSSRRGLCMGYCIVKGVSERCIVRLLLTKSYNARHGGIPFKVGDKVLKRNMKDATCKAKMRNRYMGSYVITETDHCQGFILSEINIVID